MFEVNEMTLADGIIIVIILVVVVAAAYYIRREKKQGKCVGCPYAKECAAKKAGQNCGSQSK